MLIGCLNSEISKFVIIFYSSSTHKKFMFDNDPLFSLKSAFLNKFIASVLLTAKMQ